MGIFNDNLYSYEEMEEKCRLHFIAGEFFYQFTESYEPRDWSISFDKGDFSEYELITLCNILSLKTKEKKLFFDYEINRTEYDEIFVRRMNND